MADRARIDKARREHNESAYPPIADMGADIVDGSFVPIGDIVLSMRPRDFPLLRGLHQRLERAAALK
jgi:hypothetical protein